jgi:hypothetical protein
LAMASTATHRGVCPSSSGFCLLERNQCAQKEVDEGYRRTQKEIDALKRKSMHSEGNRLQKSMHSERNR